MTVATEHEAAASIAEASASPMGLSDEELEAMEADGDEGEALDTIIDDEDGEEDADNDGDDEPETPESKPAADDIDDDGDDDAEPQTPMHIAPVDEYDAKIKGFSDQKAALRQKLNDGEIDIEQYEAQKDAVVEQENDLKNAQRDYENEVRRREAEGMDEWNKQQARFFKDEANQIYANNRLLNVALDTAVKDLANDPANANRSGKWFLAEADRLVRAAMGIKPDSAADKKPAAKPSRKPDLSVIPKTLASLPAADSTETGNDEFAYLDNLEGMDLERALAQMSKDPAKEMRYLRQA
jgi:hypothetical protein